MPAREDRSYVGPVDNPGYRAVDRAQPQPDLGYYGRGDVAAPPQDPRELAVQAQRRRYQGFLQGEPASPQYEPQGYPSLQRDYMATRARYMQQQPYAPYGEQDPRRYEEQSVY